MIVFHAFWKMLFVHYHICKDHFLKYPIRNLKPVEEFHDKNFFFLHISKSVFFFWSFFVSQDDNNAQGPKIRAKDVYFSGGVGPPCCKLSWYASFLFACFSRVWVLFHTFFFSQIPISLFSSFSFRTPLGNLDRFLPFY